MRIIFPEYKNPLVQAALAAIAKRDQSTSSSEPLEPLSAASLEEACEKLRDGAADAMVAGLDHSTRDVILACRDILGLTGETFSGSVYLRKTSEEAYLVADCAACKHPTEDQLYDICLQTAATAEKLFAQPRLALLSFSTAGSARDGSIELLRAVLARLRAARPDLAVDGEMQLDCAVDPRVAARKMSGSAVAGGANVLICPDLNSGNILYKSLEYFAHFRAAGPLLQGFKKPVSDLSRGSTSADIELTIDTLRRLYV